MTDLLARVTLTSTVTLMEGMTTMDKPRTARLVISGDVNDNLDMALIDVSHELRRRVAKVEFCDAVIRVALQHLDEIKTALTSPEVTPDD